MLMRAQRTALPSIKFDYIFNDKHRIRRAAEPQGSILQVVAKSGMMLRCFRSKRLEYFDPTRFGAHRSFDAKHLFSAAWQIRIGISTPPGRCGDCEPR
jgi:hypothetical protein